MITEGQIDEIKGRIVENFKPEKIILFGSYAEGNFREDSDLDLLIIKESNIPRYKRGREVRKYLRGLKVPIDLIVYTKDEIQKWNNVKTAFITTVIEKGRVLYG
ncbi:MAG: nucleotidyltransferase domain-containing protein [bacterium]